MSELHFELRMRPEALGLERLLANLRRRQLNLLRFSAAQTDDALIVSLSVRGKDEASVVNLLRRLTDVEEVNVLAAAHAGGGFWNHFENPFG